MEGMVLSGGQGFSCKGICMTVTESTVTTLSVNKSNYNGIYVKKETCSI